MGAPGWRGERCGKYVETRDRKSLSHLARGKRPVSGAGGAAPQTPASLICPLGAAGERGGPHPAHRAVSLCAPFPVTPQAPQRPQLVLPSWKCSHVPPSPPGALTLPAASSPSLASLFTLPQAPIPGSSRALALLPPSPSQAFSQPGCPLLLPSLELRVKPAPPLWGGRRVFPPSEHPTTTPRRASEHGPVFPID